MMSMVDLELMNFINPNLTWKTVSKGSRSASRRSRKPVARSLKGVEQLDKSPKRAEDTSVSESEKLGVDILGRRFGDKVENVPIKKRRFLFQSPSPQLQTPSSRPEESEQLVNSQHASGQWSYPNSISKQRVAATDASTAMKFSHADDGLVNGKISGVRKEKPGYSEDFSGIEILAAAACYDSMGDDVDIVEDDSIVEENSTQEAIDASSSTMPSKETVAFLGTTNFFQDSVQEDDLHGSFSEDNSVPVPPNISANGNDRTLKMSVTSRDDRSHWDLNTVMDAWEPPYADVVVDSQTNAKDDIPEDGMRCENQENLEGCKILRDSGDDIGTVGKVVSPDAHGVVHVLSDSRNLALATNKVDREEHKLVAYSTPNQTSVEEKCVPTSTELAPESLAFPVSGAEDSAQAVVMDACLDLSPCAGSDFMTGTLMSEENRNSEPASIIVQQSREDWVSGMDVDKTVSLEIVQVESERHDVAFSHAPVSEKTLCESILNEECEDSGITSGLHDKRNSPRLSTDTSQSPGPDVLNFENSVSKSCEAVGLSHSSPKCGDLSLSGATAGEGQPVVTEVLSGQDDKASGADKVEVDPPACLGSKELMNKSSGISTAAWGEKGGFSSHEESKSCGGDPGYCSGKLSDSDAFRGDQVCVVGTENMTELQEGYDSQFEDGELRESVVHCWEDSEAEDGEAENVDYESEDRDTYDVDAVDYSVSFENGVRETSCQPCLGGSLVRNIMDAEFSEGRMLNASKTQLNTESTRKDGIQKLDMDMKADRGLNAGSVNVSKTNEHFSRGNALKEPSHSASSKSKIPGWEHQLPEGCVISADMNKEVNDGNVKRNHSNGCIDGPDVKAISSRAVGMRESRRRIPSPIEGPSSSEFSHRNDNLRLQQNRSNNVDDAYFQAERGLSGSDRYVGRMRSTLHMHGRRQLSGHWDDHSLSMWDSKHHHFPSYDAPYDSRKPRPKSIVVNSVSKVEDSVASGRALSKAGVSELNYRIRGQSIYSSSKGLFRPFVRRRSPVDRDDDYRLHMGIPARDFSPDRTRGRSGRYPQGFSPREGYYRSLPNDSAESYVPHHLARRERSFSPILRKGPPPFSRPHERYRSRSRSRSPLMRRLPRERNTGLRPLSRSPDFRSEARMERVRLPIQKPSFASDYEIGFMSPPRSHFSPQRNPRWIDDRNCAADDFRDRRSPAGMFRQSNRFSSPGSPGQLKLDDYFRPAMRSARFPEMACAGRGRKYEGNDDDRRKHGNRHEMIRQVRRYVADGGVRRFRYGVEGFAAHDSHDKDDYFRNTDRRHRDIPRRTREERDRLRYGHDKM